jgi:hypothetical protein
MTLLFCQSSALDRRSVLAAIWTVSQSREKIGQTRTDPPQSREAEMPGGYFLAARKVRPERAA